MDAWAHDLTKIRETHEECKHLIKSVKLLAEEMEYYKRSLDVSLNDIHDNLESFTDKVTWDMGDITCALKTMKFTEDLKEIHDIVRRIHNLFPKPYDSRWIKFKKWMGFPS